MSPTGHHTEQLNYKKRRATKIEDQATTKKISKSNYGNEKKNSPFRQICMGDWAKNLYKEMEEKAQLNFSNGDGLYGTLLLLTTNTFAHRLHCQSFDHFASFSLFFPSGLEKNIFQEEPVTIHSSQNYEPSTSMWKM